MAFLKKVNGATREGLQGYEVRWRERRSDGGWRERQQRVYGREAAQELRDEKAKRHEGRSSRASAQMALGDACDLWLRLYATTPRRNRDREVERTSWDAADTTLEVLCEELGTDREIGSITYEDLERMVTSRTNLCTGEPVAAGTRARTVGVLKAMWTDLQRRGILVENVASDLPSYQRQGESKQAIVPSVKGLERLAEELDRPTIVTKQGRTRPTWLNAREGFRPSDRLWLFALGGWRWSEARGLTVTDDEGAVLRLHQTWPRRATSPRSYGKNRHSLRTVPVMARLRPVVDRLKAFSRDGYLFTGPDGTVIQYETWRNQMVRAQKASGVDLSTHQLRHFAASLWIQAGASVWLVQRVGGWGSADEVTATYGHLWPSAVTELGERVDELDWERLS